MFVFLSKEFVRVVALVGAWLALLLGVFEALSDQVLVSAAVWFLGGLLIWSLVYLLVFASEELERIARNSQPTASDQSPRQPV